MIICGEFFAKEDCLNFIFSGKEKEKERGICGDLGEGTIGEEEKKFKVEEGKG